MAIIILQVSKLKAAKRQKERKQCSEHDPLTLYYALLVQAFGNENSSVLTIVGATDSSLGEAPLKFFSINFTILT